MGDGRGRGWSVECEFSDMCGEKFTLVAMGSKAEGIACGTSGTETPMVRLLAEIIHNV